MRTSFKRFNAIAVIFMLASFSVSADHQDSWGPNVGTSIPEGLSVTTHDGKTVEVADLAAKNGVAIAFVRSADWCPFCKRQMIELNKSRDEFAKRGVELVALSYDSVEILSAFAKKRDIGYTLVSDKDSAVIDAFGIRNKDHEEGSSGYGIPHPGIMVFDSTGVLVAKFAEEGYRKRPPVEGVLAAIDGVQAKYER